MGSLHHDAPEIELPFPPPPRSWPAFVDDVIGRLDHVSDLSWVPVRLPGMHRPWVGIQALDVKPPRPWQWDVVTPEDAERDRSLRVDPLVLAVPQDVVVVALRCLDRPDVELQLQVAVQHVPVNLEFAASALPPPPWYLELSTGWSAGAIASALRDWSLVALGHQINIHPDASPPASDNSDRYVIGEELSATEGAFDQLLAVGLEGAAVATAAFAAARDALAPYR